MRLRGKTALITGASSGIGRACALRFAREGAKLVLTGRRASELASTAATAGGAQTRTADLAHTSSLARLCDEVLGTVDRLDVLVHCAGVGLLAPADSTDPADARHLMALNLLAPVEITRRLRPALREGGTIVMVSSLAGKVALPRMAVYSASKHALNAYADALRAELRRSGIGVLSVCPGFVRTRFAENMLQGAASRLTGGQRRHSLSPARCADAIVDGVCRGRRTVVIPPHGWLLVAAERAFPTLTRAWLLRKAFPREER